MNNKKTVSIPKSYKIFLLVFSLLLLLSIIFFLLSEILNRYFLLPAVVLAVIVLGSLGMVITVIVAIVEYKNKMTKTKELLRYVDKE